MYINWFDISCDISNVSLELFDTYRFILFALDHTFFRRVWQICLDFQLSNRHTVFLTFWPSNF